VARWLALCAGLAVCMTSRAESWAAVSRYALLIGAPVGDAGEPLLRFAERDARRVRRVLTRLGRVPEENVLLLLDGDSAAVQRALGVVAERVAAAQAREPGNESLVFVYFSGHADAQALHLGGSQLAFAELRRRVAAAGAQLSIVVVDACRSGGMTRVKGARPAEPFRIQVDDRLSGEGLAIITSSAESEAAQESDRLQGSFFTHHLVTGLRGAADRSADGQVTLIEAYEYAHTETVRSTSRTPHVQHPTYSFSLKGRREVVLSYLRGGQREGARVVLEEPGTYLLFQGGRRGPVAAELSVSRNGRLVVEPGRYLVRRAKGRQVWEGRVRLRAGAERRLRHDDLDSVPVGRVVRKGLTGRSTAALAVLVGGGLRQDLVPETGLLPVGLVGAQLDLEQLTVQLRLHYGRGGSSNSLVSLTQDVVGLHAAVLRFVDVGPLTAGFGLRAGVDGVRQTFETRGEAPPRSSLLGRAGALVHLGGAPLSRLSLWAELGADAVRMSTVDPQAPDQEPAPVARLVPFASVGATVYLR